MEWNFLSISTTLGGVYVTFVIVRHLIRKMTYNFPPGPIQLPLLGNIFNVNSRDLHLSLWGHKKQYGDVSYVKLAGKDLVVLNTMDAIREALKSDELSGILVDRSENFFSQFVLRHDIATQSYSAEWKDRRCAVLRGLTATIQHSAHINAALEEEFVIFESKIREIIGQAAFDPVELIRLTVTNCVLISLVGRRFDYDHDVFRHFKEFATNAEKLFAPSAIVLLNVAPTLRYLPFWIGDSYRKMEEARDGLTEHLLHASKREGDEKRATKPGVVHEMLRSQKSNDSITDESIVGFILDSQSAGIISVQETLLHALYQLLFRPDVQKKIAREIDGVVGRKYLPKLDHVDHMPYTEAVVTEVFRLSSVVSLSVPRSSRKDIGLLGYRLPKGTVFMPNLWRVHHDEDLWHDPWAFRPERFIDDDGSLRRDRTSNVIPFCIGERSCLGEAFSRTRLLFYLARICQKFDIFNDDMSTKGPQDARDFQKSIVIRAPPYKIQLRERLY